MKNSARILALLIVLTAPAAGQKRYLVAPDQEVVPLPKESVGRDLVRRTMEAGRDRAAANCSSVYYPMEPWDVNSVINGTHKDIFGQWYTAPAAGNVDTIYFYAGSRNSAYDSTVFLRVHRSNIGPGYGPGARPGPFDPPCQSWGYWVNSNDYDQGIAAFPQEATDTNWVSTYRPWTVASTPPFGEELWGDGGVPIHVHAGEINAVALADLAPLEVGIGDNFLISMRVNYDPSQIYMPHSEEQPFQLGAASMKISTQDDFYPSRNWKFYEHDKRPTSCGDTPRDSLKRGWYARGTSTLDSTEVMLWSIWYSMTVTGNKPPVIVEQSDLTSTFDTSSRLLYAIIEDCLPQFCNLPTALLRYDVNGVEQPPIALNCLSGDYFEAIVPGQPPGSKVTGSIEATDCDGATSQGPSFTYSIVPFGDAWYALDTGYACTPRDIRSTGTTLDPASFFHHSWSWNWRPDEEWTFYLPPTRDGTSGPYDLGGDLVLFNDQFRYAWIGVNGGIALTKTATESVDVNSSLQFLAPEAAPWEFPSAQKPDLASATHLMPGMFIAPFWADHVLADSTPPFGRILVGNAGDTCLFIAEWDSIGRMTPFGPESTATTFRVVLNRCDGTVEFQYGAGGDWSAYPQSLTGMQADSNAVSGPSPGYVALSRDGHPAGIAPADGRCIRMTPTVGTPISDGWVLGSVDHADTGGDYSVSHLFPGSKGFWTFRPGEGFIQIDSVPPGHGFWIKSLGTGRLGGVPGTPIHDLSVSVGNGWNLVGGPSGYVATGSITPTGGTIASPYYGYNGTYYTALAMEPGHGYWVKMNGAGTLSMNSSDIRDIPQLVSGLAAVGGGISPADPAASAIATRLTLRDARGRSQTLYLSAGTDRDGRPVDASFYELPPPPPEGSFDVRFLSGRMLEVIEDHPSPETAQLSSRNDYPISIRGARYPLTVEWEMTTGITVPGNYYLSPPGADPSSRTLLAASGTVTFDALPTGVLSISRDGPGTVPSEFALGANYPNPFNPATTFTVDIPVASDVRVEVVDILGRSIMEILTGPQPAGSHRLSWDGLDRNGVQAPSGVYIIRLTSKDFSASRKALLVR